MEVEVVGGFIEDNEVGGLIGDGETAEDEAHALTTAKGGAGFGPIRRGKKEAVEANLDVVLLEGTVVG